MRRAIAILLLAAAIWLPSPGSAQPSPPYLLTPAEIEDFRSEVGKP